MRQEFESAGSSAATVAVLRAAVGEMERELRRDPQALVRRWDLLSPPEMGAINWQRQTLELVSRRWRPRDFDSAAYIRKQDEYIRLAQTLAQRASRYRLIRDRANGIEYLVRENETTRRIVAEIQTALSDWFQQNHTRDGFFSRSAQWGLAAMLEERVDLVAALRAAQRLPLDSERFDVGVDRPAYVEAAELVIGIIPVVGNAVAAYEAYTGRDLFGYRLTAAERTILGAAVLLPVAGRLLKGGRALYSTSRMTRLYGRDAATWSRTMSAGQRLSSVPGAVRELNAAEQTIRRGGRVGTASARRLGQAFNSARLSTRAPAAVSVSIPNAIRDAFSRLSSRHPILAELDDLALDRIVRAGPNADHMKGQLLEELLESRVVTWLRDPAGKAALGLEGIRGEVHFVPGHLIRDSAGRQITDGIIYRMQGDIMEVLTVFECKAGRAAARELRTTSGGSAARAVQRRMSESERTELLGYARDVLRDLQDQALANGTTVTKTLDDVLAEITLTERGGQIMRDFERLGASVGETADALTVLNVSGRDLKVRISRRWTRFVGVLPSGFSRGRMQRDLQALGYAFEIMGMPISARSLRSIAADLARLVL
ncbi:pre-toxin TG domain-containing protein [Lentisalinibacter salinarum]|uniref:pre-toxin TG domain-containing protein n=1 Tax=Lentisalinibacter salinarum TaxID=2992239 RepID=UPI00386E9B01